MLLLALALAFGAADAEALKQAQTHFRAGKTHYDLGHYPEAISEFAAGYALVPRPEFLLNLGQAYRRNRELARAKEMFERYLEKAPANAPERQQVRETLAELAAQSEVDSAPSPPPSLTPAVKAAPAAVQLEAQPGPARHLAWAVPVAVVVVASVVTGIVLATRSTDACASAQGLGCWDLRPR
ncbi:MAG: hypothetical protein IPJ65_26725 [Archangiaceae bacterium]|nr:hypothetical protein [Archangiaceae bacterium]